MICIEKWPNISQFEVWSCGTKLLLWHWSQPLAYFTVFGVYYCSLPSLFEDIDEGSLEETVQGFGMVVLVREVIYFICTLLALWLNPAYLLLELSAEPADQAAPLHFAEACCPRFWKRAKTLQSWVLYLLAPHHFVTLSLRRAVQSTDCGGCKAGLLAAVAAFNIIADFAGVACLGGLMQLDPDVRPTGLVVGYWLTAAGFAAGGGGFGFALLASAVSDSDAASGEPLQWSCLRRLVSGLAGLVVGPVATLFGLFVLVRSTLAIAGVW